MTIVALIVASLLISLISLGVFGGGQVFMPFFVSLWSGLNSWFKTGISDEQIGAVFAVGNSTPGILSPKFAAITGYWVSQGAWWGYIAMFITYLAFCVPPIIVMQLAVKYTDKFDNSIFLKKLIQIMNPIVTGIIFALAIQLFIGLIAPNVIFNKSITQYIGLDSTKSNAQFYSGWRQIALWCYVPIGIISSFLLYRKKAPMFSLILGNVVIAMLVFQPWLN